MARRPTPRAMRKIRDETEIGEASPGRADPLDESPRAPPVRRGRPDPLPKEIAYIVGRPGVYCEHYPELARRLALVGLTDEEMAKVFGIAVATLYRWDESYPLFREFRARGGVVADAEVTVKLFHRAIGYDHEAVKIFMPAGAKEPVYAPYTEHIPPDVQAATWWLKNRQRDKWRDRTETSVDGSLVIEHKVTIEATRAELIRRLDAMAVPAPLTIEGEVEPPKELKSG